MIDTDYGLKTENSRAANQMTSDPQGGRCSPKSLTKGLPVANQELASVDAPLIPWEFGSTILQLFHYGISLWKYL